MVMSVGEYIIKQFNLLIGHARQEGISDFKIANWHFSSSREGLEERKARDRSSWAIPRIVTRLAILAQPGVLRDHFINHPEKREFIVEDLIQRTMEQEQLAPGEIPEITPRDIYKITKKTKPDAYTND